MSERLRRENPFSDSDITALELVFAYHIRINDAHESGSGQNVSELGLEMKEKCDQHFIAIVEEMMQRERQLLRTDQAQ